MLGKRYKIAVFTCERGLCRTVHLRGGTVLLLGLGLLALTANFAFLAANYQDYRSDVATYADVQIQSLENRRSLAAMARQFVNVQEQFSRVLDFNSKLEVMLNLDGPGTQADAMGGRSPEISLFSASTLYQRNALRLLAQEARHLEQDMSAEEVHQQELSTAVSVLKERLTRIPCIWPLRGRLSSGFGYRRSPFTGRRQFHKGIDISARTGSPIHSPANGVVTFAGRFTTYGLAVDIDHGSGITTRYAHLSRINVMPGQHVSRNDVIGLAGNTGRSVAPHLHYEIRVNNQLVNPLDYILD